MTSAAQAMQQGLEAQRVVDLIKIAAKARPCTTLTCARAKYWRDRADIAMNEVEVLRRQLRSRGITPVSLRDGHEAGYGHMEAPHA